jgi:SAM-dependent methyltransferase
MSISIDSFWIKHTMKVTGDLKVAIESGPHMFNGTYFLLTPDHTAHYQALKTDDYTWYKHLLESANDTVSHSIETFKTLYETFDIEKMDKIIVNVYAHSNMFWVQDGNHRLAILKYKQLFGNTVPLKYLQINYYDDVQDILKAALRNTVEKPMYNGWSNRTEFGYHGFDLQTIHIQGQRNPQKRYEKIKSFYDFTDKTVLDLGCNTGGMLFHIPEIKRGIGIDYDQRCIDSCNVFKEWLKYTCELNFYKADLNELDIANFCKEQDLKIDIIFLLSIGSWVRNWVQLYTACFHQAKYILLETNNDDEGKPQLDLFKKLGGIITLISDKSDDDCTGNMRRKTYLIKTVL